MHESPLAIKELRVCNAKVETLYTEGQSHQGQLSSGENTKACLVNWFWKTMKLFRKNSATTLSMTQPDGTCADNELDKANMLNNYFSKRFTTSLPHLHGSFESAEHLELPF